jgi:Flp pilus assembly protein TadG
VTAFRLILNRYVCGNRKGSAATELAIVLPFLVSLTLGTVDFGRFANTSLSVKNAARCGAYFGSANPTAAKDTAGIRNAVLQDLQTVSGVSAADVTVTSVITTDSQGYKTLNVTVTVPFKTLFGYPTDGVTLAPSCQMRIRPDQTTSGGS